uniref:Uncharacterized protein n=1 Tax=Tetradesmus obliquus TaxID=3088 RepID=A0A383WFT3_TETOB|eukprot:jgi/Sobl393_1/16989/SZX76407.1
MQELVHQHSIFKLLAQASSRALQLLLKATSKKKSKAVLLWSFTHVQLLLKAVVDAWRCYMAGLAPAALAAEKQLVLQQLQESGFLQTSLAACTRDTAWLEQQLLQQRQQPAEQQQQQQQQQGGRKQAAKKQRQPPGNLTAAQADAAACVRIRAYLSLLPELADCCGYDLLAGPLATQMELWLRLMWTVLRCEEASRSSTSSSSPSTTRPTAQQYANDALAGAFASALDLLKNIAGQVQHNCQLNSEFPQMADPAASDALYHLLLLNLALHTRELHEGAAEQTTRQERLPQQHHAQLLQELGVGGLQISAEQHRRQLMEELQMVKVVIGQSDRRKRTAEGSSSSGAGAGGGGSSSCRAVEAAAMLTLLQATLLRAAEHDVASVEDMAGIIAHLLAACKGSAREAAAAVLLQPVLTQLLPASLAAAAAAAQTADGASNAAAQQLPASAGQTGGVDAAAVSPGASQHAACLHTVIGALCMLLVSGGAAAQLQEAYASHPQQVCCSLEAALRFTLQAQHAGTVRNGPDRIDTLVEAACTCICSTPDSSSSSSSSSSVGPAVSGAAAKQMFSLLVTCLKAVEQRLNSSSSSSEGGNSESDIKKSMTDLGSTLRIHTLCFTVFSTTKYTDGQLQLLLQGRCLSLLVKIAVVMQRQAATLQTAGQKVILEKETEEAAKRAACASKLLKTMPEPLQVMVDACTASLAAACLQLPGDAAAAAKALAKLQQQGKALQQQLQSYLCLPQQQAQQQQGSNVVKPNAGRDGCSGGSKQQADQEQKQDCKRQLQLQQQHGFHGQQAEQLAQALQLFGHDICLQLPVPYWCCNSTCSNVAECSELELVSRKGSSTASHSFDKAQQRSCKASCNSSSASSRKRGRHSSSTASSSSSSSSRRRRSNGSTATTTTSSSSNSRSGAHISTMAIIADHVVQLLQKLITAPDLAFLKDALPEIRVLQTFLREGRVPPVNSTTQEVMQELVHQHSIFKLLAQASDRALHLLSRATSKERTKPALLKSYVQLQMLMPIFIIAWNSCAADMAPTAAAAAAAEAEAGAAAGKQLVLQQLEETDMLQTSLAACSRDTAWLEQQLLQQHTRQQRQQEQQQQSGAKKQAAKKQQQAPGSLTAAQADPAACVRINTYLSTFLGLAESCGKHDELLTGPLAAHMELCVRLASAVLRCEEAHSSSSSSSSSTRSSAEENAKVTFQGATMAALNVVESMAKQQARTFSLQHAKEFPQLSDAATSDALYLLLLLNLAMHTKALHDKAAAQSSGQPQLPEPHHRLLLQGLGVEWLEHSTVWTRTSMSVQDISAATVALRHHMNLAAAAREVGAGSSTPNNTSSSTLVPSHASSCSAAGTSSSSSNSNVEAAAMLTLLQASLLVGASCGFEWTQGMAYLLNTFLATLSGSAREAAAAVLLQPVLTQLLPASITATKAAAQAAASSSSDAAQQLPASAGQAGVDAAAAAAGASQQAPAEHAPILYHATGALHALLGTGGAAAQLHAAYSSHPQQVCRSLEAALRCTLQAQHFV